QQARLFFFLVLALLQRFLLEAQGLFGFTRRFPFLLQLFLGALLLLGQFGGELFAFLLELLFFELGELFGLFAFLLELLFFVLGELFGLFAFLLELLFFELGELFGLFAFLLQERFFFLCLLLGQLALTAESRGIRSLGGLA